MECENDQNPHFITERFFSSWSYKVSAACIFMMKQTAKNATICFGTHYADWILPNLADTLQGA